MQGGCEGVVQTTAWSNTAACGQEAATNGQGERGGVYEQLCNVLVGDGSVQFDRNGVFPAVGGE